MTIIDKEFTGTLITMKDDMIKSIVTSAAFTSLIIVGAIFSFPSPWNPLVPFTLATLFVILSGMIQGPWSGLASTTLYVFLGTVGLPVFAGGKGGFQVLAGPTGGFLLGYIIAAFTAGLILRIKKDNLIVIITAALAATVIIYIPGLPWLHHYLTDGNSSWTWNSTWVKYAIPFFIGDAVKAAAAVVITWYLRDRIK